MVAEVLNVVPFTDDHVEVATDIFVRVFAREPWSENWPRAKASRRLLDIVRSPGFLGVSAFRDCDDELVGFALGRLEAYCDDEHFYLQEMCVSTNVQRQGVGTRILRKLHERLKERGCNQVYLLTARESLAEAFYVSNGYTQARRASMLVTRLSDH